MASAREGLAVGRMSEPCSLGQGRGVQKWVQDVQGDESGRLRDLLRFRVAGVVGASGGEAHDVAGGGEGLAWAAWPQRPSLSRCSFPTLVSLPPLVFPKNPLSSQSKPVKT